LHNIPSINFSRFAGAKIKNSAGNSFQGDISGPTITTLGEKINKNGNRLGFSLGWGKCGGSGGIKGLVGRGVRRKKCGEGQRSFPSLQPMLIFEPQGVYFYKCSNTFLNGEIKYKYCPQQE
jgi:hypothetical protein